MKRIVYLLAVVFTLASCGGKSYTITGTVEGAYDGEFLYMMEKVKREFIKIDSTVISQGKFTFKGEQETPVNRYLVYSDDESPLLVDFFLESGTIKVDLNEVYSTATGTTLNNAYQGFKNDMQRIIDKQKALYQVLSTPALSEEEREAKMNELEEVEEEMFNTVKSGIEKNASNQLGVFLLGQYNYYLDYADLEVLIEQIPATLQEEETIIKLKERLQYAKATEVGKKFVDLNLSTPQGDPIKLSDVAGKGKYVLLDFWASWCGPCRREMPKLVEAYAQYKDKDFEIVGLSLDRDAEAWIKGIEQLGITWPQMSDLKYWDSESSKQYAVRSIPHLMLLDKEGTIIARGMKGDELLKKLAELFD